MKAILTLACICSWLVPAGVACGGSIALHGNGDAGDAAQEPDGAVPALDTGTATDAAPVEDASQPIESSSNSGPEVSDGADTLSDTPEHSDTPDVLSDAAVCGYSSGLDGDVACRSLSGNACIRCCASNNPSGKAAFDLVGSSFMCSSCSASCTASTCQMRSLPQSPCIACVKESIASECARNGQLIQCGVGDCQDFVACITRCPDS